MSKIFDALKRAAETQSDIRQIVESTEEGSAPIAPPAAAEPAAPPPTPPPAAPAARYRLENLRVPTGMPTLPFDGTASRSSEQYRMIRTRILHHPREPKVVLVSSPTPGDGKTTTAVNIAAALALKSDNTVLLVDADLRRPGIATTLGIPNSPGLNGVLQGTCALDEAIVNIAELPGLYVLPTDRPTVNPTELLDSARWSDCCTWIRRNFRYVVLDSPPVASIADYELLERTADGVVVVVRPDHTIRSLAFRVLETLPREKQLGLVVNCAIKWLFRPPNPYYYGDYR